MKGSLIVETDRQIMHNLDIQHCDGEGDYLLVSKPAGDDDEDL